MASKRGAKKQGTKHRSARIGGSGGGAAVFGGTTYQASVAAYFCVQMLAERAAVPVWKLPADTTVIAVRCEVDEAVDDVLVRLSNDARLYIQAKATADLSTLASSPLASAIDQFTRQYLISRESTGTGAWDRAIDPARDRLVLVTSSRSGAPLRQVAAGVLERLRTLDPDQPLSHAARTAADRDALKILQNHVRRSWKAATGAVATEDEVRAVLSLVYIETLDVEDDDATDAREARRELRSQVLIDETRDEAALTIIVRAAEHASGAQTGLPRRLLEQKLLSGGIALKAVRSFASDVERLRARSEATERQLAKYAEVTLGATHVAIPRESTDALERAAKSNSLLVIGEPGAGKSGAMHDLYVRLRNGKAPVVLLAADDINAPTTGALQTDLRIEHDLIDVLRNMRNVEPGLLLIDGLDALRSNGTGATMRRIIEAIGAEGLNWRVVASIRTFDLRRGTELQRLFRGTVPDVPADLQEPEFAQYRHLRVPRLTDAEIDCVRSAAPALGTAIDSAPTRLQELVRVPFNLALLAELVGANEASSSDLADIRTQLDLLELYWQRRVIRDDAEADAREAVARLACERMIADRRLRANRSDLMLAGSSATAIDALVRSHVLVAPTLASGAGEPTELAFGHHVLFDYATARLVFRRPPDVFAKLLENRALPLVVWPSIAMHYGHLWRSDPSRGPFWGTVFAVMRNDAVPTLSQVIGPMVAVDLVTRMDDLAPLVAAVTTENPDREVAEKTLRYLLMAIQAGGTRPIVGAGAGPWAALIAAIAPHLVPATAYPITNLVVEAAEQAKNLTADEKRDIGIAARALLAFGWSDARHRALVRPAITAVSRTYETNPVASRELLQRCLEADRIKEVGYEELPRLAAEGKYLVAADPDFVANLYRAAFAFEDTSDDSTQLGQSQLLALTSHRRQDYHHAWWQLGQLYPAFFDAAPVAATRALIDAVDGYEAREKRRISEPVVSFDVGGATARIRSDYSSIWDNGSGHDDVATLLRAFEEGLVGLAGADRRADAEAVLALLVEKNVAAALWRRLLKAARRAPDFYAPMLHSLLCAPAILEGDDTREDARACLQAMYSGFADDERRAIDEAITRIPEGVPEELQDRAKTIRDRIVRVLPEAAIGTDEVRALRIALNQATPTAGSEDASGESTLGFRGRMPDPFLARYSPETQAVVQRHEALARPYLNDAPDEAAARQMMDAITDAEAYLTREDLSELDRAAVERAVVTSAMQIAHAHSLPYDDPATQAARRLLLAAAESDDPKLDPQAEKQWDGHPALSDGVRARASEGLTWLAARAATANDEEVLDALSRLGADPVAGVRFYVIERATFLAKLAPSRMWKILDAARENESRVFVAAAALHAVGRATFLDIPRCVAYAIDIWRRFGGHDAPESIGRIAASYLRDLHLYHADPTASAWLHEATLAADEHPTTTSYVAHAIRDAIVESDPPEDRAGDVRARTIELAREILRVASAAFLRVVESPEFKTTPLAEDAKERLKAHATIIATLAMEVQFALASADDEHETSEQRATRQPRVERFYAEGKALLDDLSSVGYVAASHHVLETLVEFIDLDPRGTFLRMKALLTSARRTRYQQEHEAMRLFVRIVERYLADYRDLIEQDEECREAMVTMLDLFIEAGWPPALRIALRLGDLFR
jgi:hypothetical protein